jgi:hypothetical protein
MDFFGWRGNLKAVTADHGGQKDRPEAAPRPGPLPSTPTGKQWTLTDSNQPGVAMASPNPQQQIHGNLFRI